MIARDEETVRPPTILPHRACNCVCQPRSTLISARAADLVAGIVHPAGSFQVIPKFITFPGYAGATLRNRAPPNSRREVYAVSLREYHCLKIPVAAGTAAEFFSRRAVARLTAFRLISDTKDNSAQVSKIVGENVCTQRTGRSELPRVVVCFLREVSLTILLRNHPKITHHWTRRFQRSGT